MWMFAPNSSPDFKTLFLKEKGYLEKLEGGAMGGQLKDDKRSKSYEEREEEYERARARIFNQDVSFLFHDSILIELTDGNVITFSR